MKTISVIIPMYNAEAFIRQSIQSVIDQTYHNFEILVIDDGSVDRGAEICEEMRREDNRIHLYYRSERKGVSAARNYGLDRAKGEYIFFLDSDDTIHPLLLEEMFNKMEEKQAGLGFCAYARVDSGQMEKIISEISCIDEKPQWKVDEGEELEERYHKKDAGILMSIGSKMIRMDVIGSLRFDENLPIGEDTMFMYHLVSRHIRAVFSLKKWYYYRMHPKSVTHTIASVREGRYFECVRRIRDLEYQKGRFDFALRWESRTANMIEKHYLASKRIRNKEGISRIKKIAKIERKHPLYLLLPLSERLLFISCFRCRLIFHIYRRLRFIYGIMRKKMKMNRTNSDTGILTFHCVDNYGSMLQAYGLKAYLYNNGIEADVIRYDPLFITSKQWNIPNMLNQYKFKYRNNMKKQSIWGRVKVNIGLLEKIIVRRKKMRYFRERYLVSKDNPKLLSIRRFKKLQYSNYIVGSDQIWNPDITKGMRNAYFGAFENKKKEKVISYAVSLGGTELESQYEEEFSRLLKYVDVISVKDKEVVPFIKKYREDVKVVLDPVFFLKVKFWEKVEILPQITGYILLYITDTNQELVDYAQGLAREKLLKVIEISSGQVMSEVGFTLDYSSGPSEFLGYIHKADYIVSNSFYAIAFSIIYQKKFLAFLNDKCDTEIKNILRLHGLENRIFTNDSNPEIDEIVNWEEVSKKTQENIETASRFLIQNLV